MIGLIDLDSIFYTSVHKCVSIDQMRGAIHKYGKEEAREWFEEEVIYRSCVRAEDRLQEIEDWLNDNFQEDIFVYEYFVTKCSNSFRKKLSPEYKANRKRNRYVGMLRDYFINTQDAKYSDVYEADDLISDRAKELKDYIIISIDKDLKQIGGWYWSPYKNPREEGNVFQQKEVVFIEPSEANFLFWVQVLMGDTSDNIKGVKGIGAKKATKILKDSDNLSVATYMAYINNGQKADFLVNYELIKLGSDGR